MGLKLLPWSYDATDVYSRTPSGTIHNSQNQVIFAALNTEGAKCAEDLLKFLDKLGPLTDAQLKLIEELEGIGGIVGLLQFMRNHTRAPVKDKVELAAYKAALKVADKLIAKFDTGKGPVEQITPPPRTAAARAV